MEHVLQEYGNMEYGIWNMSRKNIKHVSQEHVLQALHELFVLNVK